jgi:hypothetical protein
MTWRTNAWILILFATSVVSAQDEYGACPEGYISPGLVQRACLRSLPWSGLLWMRGENGLPCHCACPDRSVVSLEQLVLARDERFQRFRHAEIPMNKGIQWRKATKGLHLRVPAFGPITGANCTIGPDGISDLFPLSVANMCDDYADLLHVLRKLQASGIVPDFSVFISSDPGDATLPSRMPILDQTNINLPPVFLRSPEVGIELLEFMLLHELGHGYNESSDECLADQFAAEVGMRTLYPGPALIFMLEEAMKQYLAYTRALTGESDHVPPASAVIDGVQSCSAIGRYPRYSCRAEAIMFIRECYSGRTDPTDCPDTYNATCWSGPYAREGPMVTTKSMCTPIESCPEPLNEGNKALNDQLLLIDVLQRGVAVKDICAKYPTICDPELRLIEPASVPSAFRSPEERAERKVKRSLDRMLKRALKAY